MEKTLFIDNASRFDVIQGFHIDPDSHRTILIQISDCNEKNPKPKYKDSFVEIYRFNFDDTEDIFDMNCITDHQAQQIADILKQAVESNCNIVVHCFAGIRRSGAVAEVGRMLGFTVPEGRNRIPNVLVKRKIMEKLGISINPSTSMFTTGNQTNLD